MLGVLAKMTELAGEHRGPSGRIDNPARAYASFRKIDNCIYGLSISAVQFALCDLGWPPEIASGLDRAFQQMRVELCSIDLKRLQARLITRPDLNALVKALVR